MKRLLFTLFIISTIFYCTKDSGNNLLPPATTDYRYSAAWIGSDTAELFDTKGLVFTNAGSDTFRFYRWSIDSSNKWDTAAAGHGSDTVRVFFTKIFNDIIHTEGIRPDSQKISHGINIVVINPFNIVGSDTAVDSAVLHAGRSGGSKSYDDSLRVLWYINDTMSTTKRLNDLFMVNERDSFIVSAKVFDFHGDTVEVQSRCIYMRYTIYPTVDSVALAKNHLFVNQTTQHRIVLFPERLVS